MFCGRFTANENNNKNRRFIYNAQWNRKQSFYTHTHKKQSPAVNKMTHIFMPYQQVEKMRPPTVTLTIRHIDTYINQMQSN